MAFSFFGPNFFYFLKTVLDFRGVQSIFLVGKPQLRWRASKAWLNRCIGWVLWEVGLSSAGLLSGLAILIHGSLGRGWRILHTGGWLLALWCTSVGVDQNAKRSQDAITWDRALPIGQLAQGLLTHVYALGACKSDSDAEHNICHLSTSIFWQMA